ncbi:MAG TPA: SusC/RagA family TonB-linked outer membrane protein [Chitinophagaceae bacterium]
MRKLLSLCLLLLCSAIIQAQNRTIKGRVTDELGAAVPFATITVKGSKAAAVADESGNFTISAKSGDVLVITATNHKSSEVKVGAQDMITVALTRESNVIDEVVVTAQGVKRRPKELGYSAVRITNTDITVGKSPQLAQSLSGKVSGLTILNANNSVDPAVKITLRGYRSLTGDNNALIVIDGMPMPKESSTMLNLLNPNDIESITILKGGQAATLYGSDGVNGAVVITTKKGTKGKVKVNFTNSTNIEEISFLPQFQDKYGSGSHYAASYGSAGYKPNYLDRMKDNWRPFENQQFGDPYNGEIRIAGRVLQDGSSLMIPYAAIKGERRRIWNTGLTTNNQVSFSGGSDNTTFYLSVENNLAQGIVPDDESKRTGVRLAAQTESGRLKVGFNAAYVQSKYDRTTFDFYFETINQAAHIPLSDLRDWRNNKFANPNGYYNDYYNNPYFRLDNDRTNYGDANISGNLDFTYKLAKWVSLYNRVSVLNNARTQKNTVGKFTYSTWAKTQAYVPAPWAWANDYNGINRALADLQGSVYDASINENVFNNDFQVQMDKQFGAFENKMILGVSFYDRKTKGVEVSSGSIVVPGVNNVVNRQGELGGGEANSQYRKYGYYADLLSGWKDKVFVHGTFRYDASSKFYKPTRTASMYSFPYYGVDVSLIATEIFPEIQNKWLSYAKIRAGYNRNGNDNIPLYGLDLSYANAAGFPYGNTVGISVGDVLPDKDLKPEFVKSFEVGAELQLLKNRLSLDFTYYTQRSEGQVLTVKIPNTTGFSNLRANIGDFKNWGYEVDIRGQVIRGHNFMLDLNARYSMNDNKVVSLYQGVPEFFVSGYSYAGTYAALDNPFPILKANSYVRDPEGRVVVNATTGYPLTSGPLKSFGRTLPKHMIGWGTSMAYKNLSFTANFEYRGGNMIYSDLGRQMTFTGSGKWTENRDPHIFPNSAYMDGTGKYVENTSVMVREPEYALWVDYYRLITENFVVPGWFIKMRDANLTYTFPDRIVSKAKILSGAAISIYGRNLFTIVDERNDFTDPEFSFTTGNGVGVNNTAQTPPVRQYGVSINLSFK